MAVKLLASRKLAGDACCAAACPADADTDADGTFVVGTYTLDAACGARRGVLYVFQGAAVEAASLQARLASRRRFARPVTSRQARAQEVAALDTAGIFDVRWAPKGGALVAVACADGSVLVCRARASASAPIGVVCGAQCAESAMCTSVDWLSSRQLVACDQSGQAHLLDVGEVRTRRARRRAAACC